MNAERLLQHYEKIADAPDAIARLRRFVLDLAVRGKLVPQDESDEAIEGISLEIVGRRRGQLRAEIPASYALPSQWRWRAVQTIAAQVTDGEHATPPRTSEPEVPLVTAKNVRDGSMDLSQTDWVSFETANKAWKRCRPQVGDILLVCVGATTGRLTVLREPTDMVLVRSVALIRPNNDVASDYLEKAFRSSVIQTQIWSSVKATAQPCLYINRINSISIPLPPLAEQHRIVAKVDELMALCDQLEAAQTEREAKRGRLAAASLTRLSSPDPETFHNDARFVLEALPALTARPDQIKQLRQTILNLAVRGKLLPQDPEDEPAEELLKRIAHKKDAKRPQTKARRNGLPSAEGRTDDELERNWVWTQLDDVALSMRYGTSTKCDYLTKGAPVLRIPNVSSGRISLDDLKFGPLSQSEIDDLSLLEGDLLLIRSNGSLEIVGRAAVVTPEAAGMTFAGYLVRLRMYTDLIDPAYIWLALQSSEVRSQIEQPIRSAVGLKNVNLTEFGGLTFRLPPLAEQHRIVAKVDEIMALCHQLEVSLTTAGDTRRKLLDALLAEALAPLRAEELQEAAE